MPRSGQNLGQSDSSVTALMNSRILAIVSCNGLIYKSFIKNVKMQDRRLQVVMKKEVEAVISDRSELGKLMLSQLSR
ncbi:Laccase-20 [Dirofilaria immitis]